MEAGPLDAVFADLGGGMATWKWATGFADAGSSSVTFNVSDGATTARTSVTLRVENVNRRPAIAAPLRKSATVGQVLGFVIAGADPDGDIPALILVGGAPAGALFSDLGDGTATFTWTPPPSAADAGGTDLVFAASDGELFAETSTRVDIFPPQNRAPVLTVGTGATVAEGDALSFDVSATDPDGDPVLLLAQDLPANAEFLPAGQGRRFVFRPGYAQSGAYTVTFMATDSKLATLEPRLITVLETQLPNQPPVVTVIGPAVVFEGQAVALAVRATDPEGTIPTISRRRGSGAFLDHLDGTGNLDWTPGFDDAGTTLFEFAADDGSTSTIRPFVLTVLNVNRRPQIGAPSRRGALVGQLHAFTVTASDPDGGFPTIAFDGPSPSGAQLTDNSDGTALFAWTPDTAAEAAGGLEVGFAASDGEWIASATTRIDVLAVPNRPPTLTVTGSNTVSEGQTLFLTLESSDPDGDAILLLANNMPANASLSAAGGAGTFTFAPDYAQGGATYPITFLATDSKAATPVERHLFVVDLPGVNNPPTLRILGRTTWFEGELVDLSMDAQDADGDGLTLEVLDDPPDAIFVSASGDWTWLTDYADAGTQVITFRASDSAASTDVVVAITIADVNRRPSISAPARRTATVGVALGFTVNASDPDGTVPAIQLQSGLPAGAAFADNSDGTATFTWTPPAAATEGGGTDLIFSASDGSLATTSSTRVDVFAPLNRPPALGVTGDPSVQEGGTLVLSLISSDPDGDSVLLLVSGAPANSSILDRGDGTGTFTFRPSFSQAGGYTVTFVATDLSASTSLARSFNVTELAGNTAPTLLVAGATRVQETGAFAISVVAFDADGSTPSLTATPLPQGATFQDRLDGTGAFQWTTDFDDEGSYAVEFRASDGNTDTRQGVQLVVDKRNRPPSLKALFNRAVTVGAVLNQTIEATDPDGDPVGLTFGPPRGGASLTLTGPALANFAYQPGAGDANSTYTFSFTASDASLSDVKSMQVAVLPTGANRAPAWNAVGGPPTVFEGQTLALVLAATDPDGTVPTVYATNLPANALFPPGSGSSTLTYTPDFGVSTGAAVNVGVALAADDGASVTFLSFNISVSNTNRPPVLTSSMPDVQSGDGASAVVNAFAYDPDPGTTLTYIYVVPSPLVVNHPSASSSSATIGFPRGSFGVHNVQVKVRDNFSLEATDSFSVTVTQGHFRAMTTSTPQPPFEDDSFIYDRVHHQLVVVPFRRGNPPTYAMDRIWTLSLHGDAATQEWREKSFGPGEFPGHNPGSVLPNNNLLSAVGVFAEVDAGTASIFVFRTETQYLGPNNDVWKLDLTPGAESWTQVDSTNPSTGGGCQGNISISTQAAFLYDAQSERIVCLKLGGATGGAFKVRPPASGGRWSNYGASGPVTTVNTGNAQWLGSGQDLYTLFTPVTSSVAMIVKTTMGPTSATSVELFPVGAPLTYYKYGSMALDPQKNRLLIFGGERVGLLTNELWQFDLGTYEWSHPAPNNTFPDRRYGARVVVAPVDPAVEPPDMQYFVGGGCTIWDNNANQCVGTIYFLGDLWVGDISASGF